MNFNEILQKRESCRNYSDKKISEEILMNICEAGRLAPSACNSQPWSFHVVLDDNKLTKVKEAVQVFGMNKFVNNAPSFIVIVEEKANLSERIGQRVGERDFASIDIGIATAHMVLCATSLGVSTCILGAFKSDKIIDALNIKEKSNIRLVLVVGYSLDNTTRLKKRKGVNEVIQFHK